MSISGYSQYKDSGLEWLGEIPDYWNVKRLRFVVQLNPSRKENAELDPEKEVSFLPMEAIGDKGELNLEFNRPVSEVVSGYTYFREGDVTLAKITPCFENGKGAIMRGLTGGIGFGTTELIVARPLSGETISDYLYWLFVSKPFRSLGEASMYGAGGQKRIPESFVRNFQIAFPPVSEQFVFSIFLERETGKIRSLISEQEKLITLLKEKRQALISHAVTKGLDPSVSMKDSGIEWLGEVPEHWEVCRMATLFKEVNRPGDPSMPVLSISIHNGITDNELAPEDRERQVNQIEDRTKYKRVKPNDLSYNMMRAWQGAFGAVTVDGLVSPAYVVVEPIREVRFRTEYIEHLLRSPMAIEEMRRYSRGITDFRMRLYWEQCRDLRVCLPPLEEQNAILDLISSETKRIDLLSDMVRKSIDLLKERRTALITAAVTGKIDVRQYVQEEV